MESLAYPNRRNAGGNARCHRGTEHDRGECPPGMTADQLIAGDVAPPRRPASEAERTVELIRTSFALVEPQAEDIGKHFYATLFSHAPETRDLFPVNMEVQRSSFTI